jgi:hypothetical protein
VTSGIGDGGEVKRSERAGKSGASRRVVRRAALPLLLLAAFMGATGSAQQPAAVSKPAPGLDSSQELQVFLMTFGPGRQVWERFGHNAIWIHDPVRGTDQAYNYGLFDFHQQNFLLRFIRGQMWYWMAGFPAPSYLRQYERDNRSIWVQELELTPEAKRELQRFLEWNAEPEHRFYHYDYYRDNCSTRVRDALDRVLRGALHAQTDSVPTDATYRFHTQRLTANDPLISTGLLIALGPGVDRPISAWEEMFLPIKMREHVRRITVTRPDGTRVPLVRSERTVFESSAPAPPDAPPSWLLWYLAAGLVIGVSAFGLSGLARERAPARVGFVVLVGGWGVVAGLAGLILAGLWGLTDHVMAYRNQNLLQLSPVALLLLPGAVAAVRGSSWARTAAMVGLVVAGMSVLGLVLKLLPGFDQCNAPVIAMAVPAQVGIAAGLRRLAQRVRVSPSRASG